MLVWKVQSLNVNIASVRYRCLLPLRYLGQQGVISRIYDANQPVKLSPQTEAIIFVKTFCPEDLEVCEQAYQLGVPIILDLCDNIFIEGYSAGKTFVHADIFLSMARRASCIVTTGSALKQVVEASMASAGLQSPRPPVVVIPDGSETLEDIADAVASTRQQRWMSQMRSLRRHYRYLRKQLRALLVALRDLAVKRGVSPDPPPENVDPTPRQPVPWPAAPAGVKTILWFGNHGAKYGNFGMLNILEVAEALIRLAQEIPLRLVVVSNSHQKYQRHIAPLPIETVYLPWHPCQIYAYLQASDAVIVPNSQSVYSICKSANRAVLALSQGAPVVASSTPALELFPGCLWLDQWETGLRTYLTQPTVAQAHVAQAQQIIDQALSGPAIAQKWLALLAQLKSSENLAQAAVSPLAPEQV